MKINLSEIKETGETYVLDRKSAELNQILKDLIGTADYHAEFFIRPLNSRDFEVKGWIKTETPEVCSRCGIDFQYQIDAKFHEFLIPKEEQPRGSRYSHVNHVSDLAINGPEMTEYEGYEFDAGEYLHEVVGLAAPFNVACQGEAAKVCKIYEIPESEQAFSLSDGVTSEKKQNPFAALKNIKLN